LNRTFFLFERVLLFARAALNSRTRSNDRIERANNVEQNVVRARCDSPAGRAGGLGRSYSLPSDQRPKSATRRSDRTWSDGRRIDMSAPPSDDLKVCHR
jgi:hypothetical protein